MNQERSTLPSIWSAAPPGGIDRSAFTGKKPNKIIPVPHEYRRQTLSRERDMLIHDVEQKTGCDLVPHWDQGKVTSFDIYGSGHGVEKATVYLNHWISNAHTKSIGASAWAKLPAYDPNKWYYAQVEELDNVYKQRFRGPVPSEGDADAPRHAAVVDWPEDIKNTSQEFVSPREVFGNKLERLDELRMQDKVYITLQQSNHDGHWYLEILGHDVVDVELAREHLTTMIQTVRADAAGVQDAHNTILDEREGMEVELQQCEPWWPNQADYVVPQLLSHAMMDKPGSFRQEGLHFKQHLSLQRSIKAALDDVRRRKGAYDFVVRLGCLALSSKTVSKGIIGRTVSKDSFSKQIHESVQLDVKKWLANNEIGCRILHRLMAVKGFLEPTKSGGYFGYTPETLKETRPIFRGTWVFKDPNSSVVATQTSYRHPGRPAPFQKPVEDAQAAPMSLFVIQIDWTDDEQGMYEKGTPTFYKLPPGATGPKKNMDISLLELGESRAWHFALESLIPVPRKTVSPVLVGFAERVRMKRNYDISSTESFAEWDTTLNIKKYLQTGRLDSIYSFGIEKTCYKVELTAMWYPSQQLPVWGLAVRHLEWASHLAELEDLPIGRQAMWLDTISSFLPDDGQSSSNIDEDSDDCGTRRLKVDDSDDESPRDGIRILTDKLMKLSEIVSSVTDCGGVQI
ncbi:hypothetical protein CC86DRAFT_415001 [Ophiobolus disseminans]|uniref:DUF7905 domain-containing protein n=1 Tax=Ophiobolus disseminans TaxID=1469910 RepID=A0A6A7AIY5_9PLEO|nr:hypothetical protein CC86DRAFT_415001 [Ophiobolus disseminans]